jgi:hypothetical protein
LNAGGYLHHDDLTCYESALRYVAAFPSLSICEVGIFCGETSRSVRKVLGADYTHWCVDSCVEPRGVWQPPFEGARCVWKDSHEAAAEIPDGLGLVLIDGCHCLFHVLGDVALYGAKLRPGGLMLLHDANQQAQGKTYQKHGNPKRPESHISVRRAVDVLGLDRRPDWSLWLEGGDGGTWWGQFLIYQRVT